MARHVKEVREKTRGDNIVAVVNVPGMLPRPSPSPSPGKGRGEGKRRSGRLRDNDDEFFRVILRQDWFSSSRESRRYSSLSSPEIGDPSLSTADALCLCLSLSLLLFLGAINSMEQDVS